MSLTILATNPNSDLYGASRMMVESIAGFRDEDWRVVVSLPTRGPLVDETDALGAEFQRCPAPVLRKGDLSPLGLVKLAWRTLRAIPPSVRLIRSVRPDVMYINTIIEPLWLVLAKVLRVPVLCHVHEGESEASLWLRRGLALPLNLAPRLMVNSNFSTKVLIEAMPRLEDRCIVVYNGVAGPPEVTEPRVSLGAAIRLLFVGRISERKGVQDAVDTVAELERRGIAAELDVVGAVFPGYEWVEEDLHRRARAAGTDDRIRMHGFDPIVWPYMAEADVLLVPSRVDEPFGNTAVEGALAARPVVATLTSGLLEATAGMEATTLVEPGDPAAIAAAVEAIQRDWPEARARAVADADRAAEKFSPATYRATVRGLMEELAAR